MSLPKHKEEGTQSTAYWDSTGDEQRLDYSYWMPFSFEKNIMHHETLKNIVF